MVRVVVLGGNNSGGGGSRGGKRSIDQEAIIRSYTHRPPSYSPPPLLPAQAAKHLRWLQRRQQHFTRRLGLVPHPLYHGPKDVILRPPNFTSVSSSISHLPSPIFTPSLIPPSFHTCIPK